MAAGHPMGCECEECKLYTNRLISSKTIVGDKCTINLTIPLRKSKIIRFHEDDPYDMAAYELITEAIKLRQDRIAKRGKDYETVWMAMKLKWHSAIINTKALRLDDAVEKNLLDEVNENLVDILNYLIFGKHEVMKNKDKSEWVERERIG